MLTVNAPFRLIEVDIHHIYDDDLVQLMQFTIRNVNNIGINQVVGVIDILRDIDNKLYVIHNDRLYKTNRNNCTINTIIYWLYPGKQVDISIAFSSIGINMCTNMISNKKFIPDFIEALGDGVCQGDIQLN